ncbi:MAG TPA: flavodoxin family protein [Tissierellia bacterium]|nr:flavodoxin family protein [Tissierellia bacterium]
MKYLILMGSPRKNGNTHELVKPFMEELKTNNNQCEILWLYDMNIKPCLACRVCQNYWTSFGCAIKDEAQIVFDKILESHVIILATPIYSWYCTPPMKSMMDRMVYGMNKYYGDEKGPSLWAGKKVALITTCGYRPEKGSDLFEEGIKRYCKHSQLNYIGMLVERHLGYNTEFITEEKINNARLFARELMMLQ